MPIVELQITRNSLPNTFKIFQNYCKSLPIFRKKAPHDFRFQIENTQLKSGVKLMTGASKTIKVLQNIPTRPTFGFGRVKFEADFR